VAVELASLPDDPFELKKMVVSLYAKVETLIEEVVLLRGQQYGRKSEKRSLEEQRGEQRRLFDEEALAGASDQVRTLSPEEAASYRVPVRSHVRGRPRRRPLPEDLPRIEVEHDIAEAEKRCACGATLSRIGEETLEQLGIIPTRFYVLRHIRPKYACRSCDGVETEGATVKIAPPPPQLFAKSIVTPELLAWLVTSKYADGLPFYRVERIVQRSGVEISRESLCSWTIQGSQRCVPLLGLMRQELLSGPVIQADETRVQVLREPGRSASSKSYMWVYRGGDPQKPVVLFDYHPSRSAEVPLRFLKDYRGYLQTDGYKGYAELGNQPGIHHVGCWAHARRKFVEAAKVSPKGGAAEEALETIRKLYEIESRAERQKLGPEEIRQLRQKEALPILVAFRGWLERKANETPPSLALGKAISYTLGQWDRLVRYVEDGRLRPDNNLAENAIRPFVVGRKAWLFSATPEGATASATMYSLVETARANGLEPYHYLRYLFTRLLTMRPEDTFASLLPQNLKPADIVLPDPLAPPPPPSGG